MRKDSRISASLTWSQTLSNTFLSLANGVGVSAPTPVIIGDK